MDKNNTDKTVPELTKTDEPKQPTPQRWDALWQSVISQSAREIFIRAGTWIASLALIVLVVWVLKAYFDSSRAINPAAGGALNESSSGLALPGYVGAAPVSGLARSADAHTDQPTASRYSISEYEVAQGVMCLASRIIRVKTKHYPDKYAVILDNPGLQR